jgi:hypothetical protein
MARAMDIALALLRRLGLALGAYIATYHYLDNTSNIRTSIVRWIAFGLALFFFSLPRLHPPRRPPSDPRRGFEVVVPDKTAD